MLKNRHFEKVSNWPRTCSYIAKLRLIVALKLLFTYAHNKKPL